MGWGVMLGAPLLLGVVFTVAFGEAWPLGIPAVFLTVFVLLQGLQVRSFELDREGLRLHRRVSTTRIRFRDVAAVRTIESMPRGGLPVLVMHGFYGTQGIFWNRRWGTYSVYVTDPRNLVELKTTDGKRLFRSPAESDRFVEEISSPGQEIP